MRKTYAPYCYIKHGHVLARPCSLVARIKYFMFGITRYAFVLPKMKLVHPELPKNVGVRDVLPGIHYSLTHRMVINIHYYVCSNMYVVTTIRTNVTYIITYLILDN